MLLALPLGAAPAAAFLFPDLEGAVVVRVVQSRSGGAPERGIAALAQYKAREGKAVVPRGHVEELPDGTSVRLGVWLSNTRSRRAGLSEGQREQLAGLGLDWAV
ncbi:helicase associated domain-containing protein [Streptomyces sp. NPDC055287]